MTRRLNRTDSHRGQKFGIDFVEILERFLEEAFAVRVYGAFDGVTERLLAKIVRRLWSHEKKRSREKISANSATRFHRWRTPILRISGMEKRRRRGNS